MSDLYVQYGSGYSAPQGWLNFDASLTLRFERVPVVGRLYTRNSSRFPEATTYGDVVAGLPIPTGSCRGVYASHVLEHLTLADCRSALRETRRILQAGGIFRLIVPDLRIFAARYVAADLSDADASHRFMEETYLGTHSRPSSLSERASAILGRSRHLWMWDEASLAAELRLAGLTEIRRATFGDSPDEMFQAVEEEHRFVDACALQATR
jgi:hypothetical protein